MKKEGNFNDRSNYLPDILGKLNGIEFYLNDFTSTGVTYYDLCDRYNVKIGDVNCGLRAYNKEKLINLNCNCTGMEYASEMIIKAAKENLKIKEIPINFYKDKRNKKTHLRTIRDGIRHLKIILNS